MSVTEDKTFLLVKEDSGFASYNYNPETGEFVARVKPGKEINNGDLLKVLPDSSLNGGEHLNFVEGTGLSVIRLNENELGIVFDGQETLTSGHEIRSQIQNFDFLENNIKETISEYLGQFGNFSGRESGVSPVDAKYIYSWDGGRQHYLNNPDSRQKLSQLFSDSKIMADMHFAENAISAPVEQFIEIPVNEELDQRAIVEPKKSDETPKNMVTEKEQTSLGKPAQRPVNHMILLLRDFGMNKSLCDDGVFCAYKELNNGQNLIVTSATNKKLPMSNEFLVGISDDMKTNETFDRVNKEDLERVLSNKIASQNNMRP
jgi:hypothetical protein